MSAPPKPIRAELLDGEHNVVLLDAAYGLRGDEDVVDRVAEIRAEHGDAALFLPLSARSGGGGVFQVPSPTGEPVVGLSIEPATAPLVTLSERPHLKGLGLDGITICTDRREILAGAAITLEQLNQALDDRLGPGHRVLGADLTSYTYAQVGATFMTGGMGPQRRYFSDSVVEAMLFDGHAIRRLEGNDLRDHAGTYGWSGLVTSVRCRYVTVPPDEIAFALPVRSEPGSLAALLEHLAPWCLLADGGDTLLNRHGGRDLLMGIEHVTVESMGPMLQDGSDTTVSRRARTLAEKCRAAGCDGLVFVNGHIGTEPDAFLSQLLDDDSGDPPTIAGVDLAHSELFDDPEMMRSVREAIPAAARAQAPAGRFVFKGHTDATIRLGPEHVAEDAARLWQINRDYVGALTDFFAGNSEVAGQVLVYGHMNPWGVDPHNRLTFASDDREAYDQAVSRVETLMGDFYRGLNGLCNEGRALFIGGEKGAGSEREILTAFPDLSSAPTSLVDKFSRQQRVIARAPRCFNWRALPPYGHHA